MSLYPVIAVIITVTALFAYLNNRIFKLPTAVGLLFISLLFSIFIMSMGHLVSGLDVQAKKMIAGIDFSQAVLQGMLSFLLFAGSQNISTFDLKKERAVVGVLATLGVVISTVIIGFAIYGIVQFGGIKLSLMYCLVFGALISPTDPIAALSTLRSANLPKYLEARIAGEALFNDGMGLVVFSVFLTLAMAQEKITGGDVLFLMLRQIAGGMLLGVILGWITSWFLKGTSDPRVRVLVTLACANGGYALAVYFGTSAPIAVVVAGLWLANQQPVNAEGKTERTQVGIFWELIDEILNATLFVFIGFYLLILPLEWHELFAGLLAIPVVLIARYLSVGSIMGVFKLFNRHGPMATGILTWGGIRGGLSIALALSLTTEPTREIIVSMTYVVVAFSILVQGLTIRKFIHRT